MKVLVIFSIIAVFLLSACGLQELEYKNKQLPRNQVEEIIENELELQNPSLDLDVTIMAE